MTDTNTKEALKPPHQQQAEGKPTMPVSVSGFPAVEAKDAANMAKDAAEKAQKVRDELDIEVADHESALTNRVAQPPPPGTKLGPLVKEGTPAPMSAPSIGSLPVPPNEDDVKQHELAGYRATALQGAYPGETAESFDARQQEEVDAYAEAQANAAKDAKKMQDARAEQAKAEAKASK